MGSFVNSRLDELPPHLGGVEGEALATGLGKAQDDELPLLRAAAVSDLPDLCPADALQGSHPVGEWFALERYPADTDDTYRARVSAAFATWRQAGTAVAIEGQLHAFGIPDAIVLTEAWDGPIYEGNWHSRARVVLGPNFGATGIGPAILGTSTTLGGFLLGSTATVSQRAAIKRIAWKWKAVHCAIPDVYLSYEAAMLGIGTTLGSFTLGTDFNDCIFTVQPQLGDTTYLGTWVLGAVDLT